MLQYPHVNFIIKNEFLKKYNSNEFNCKRMSLNFLVVDDHVMITDCYKMAIGDLGMDANITAVNTLEAAYNLIET